MLFDCILHTYMMMMIMIRYIYTYTYINIKQTKHTKATEAKTREQV